MDSIIETFHLDIKLLIAQAVNFAIVFAVLYWFVIKPLSKIMGERTKKIEKSLEDAKEIEARLGNTKKDYDEVIAGGKIKANEIMEKANELAEKKKAEMIAKAKEEIGVIINQEKAKLQADKGQALKEIKKEMAELIASSLEKVLGEKIDAKKDNELIKKSIK